jgi:F0F1-type ATP synthase delta subunit
MVPETKPEPSKGFVLPVVVFGTIELHRIQRELEALEDYFAQSQIRAAGKQVPLPQLSRLLYGMAADNDLNLLIQEQRTKLAALLKEIADSAPVVHISFAADPSSNFTAKIVEWFRKNIHPYCMVQLGLQPAIAAGCVLRTPNHILDFSLAHHFSDKRELLVTALAGGPKA